MTEDVPLHIEKPTMNRYRRYYILHNEQRKEQQRERYNNNPKVIAKREEKARKKAEQTPTTPTLVISKRVPVTQDEIEKALATSKRKLCAGTL